MRAPGEVGAVAPRAAIDEHHHRQQAMAMRCVARRIDIEPLPGGRAIGNIAGDAVVCRPGMATD